MDEHGEQIEPDTDEVLANRRHARFGHLPARVASEDLVEEEDVQPVHEEPEEPMVRREWG